MIGARAQKRHPLEAQLRKTHNTRRGKKLKTGHLIELYLDIWVSCYEVHKCLATIIIQMSVTYITRFLKRGLFSKILAIDITWIGLKIVFLKRQHRDLEVQVVK